MSRQEPATEPPERNGKTNPSDDRIEPWRKQQDKIAQELVSGGVIHSLEDAKTMVYDGIMAYTSWDEWIQDHGTDDEKREQKAYRIAERMFNRRGYYRGYSDHTPSEKKQIEKLQSKILTASQTLRSE